MTSTDEAAGPDGSGPAAERSLEPLPAPTGRYATKAVLALVLGIVAIILLLPAGLLSLLAAITAVVLGHLAVREIRSTGDRGREIAIGGLVAGYAAIGIVLLLLVASAGARSAMTGGGPGAPDACTSTTGDFTDEQLQACFDQTNGD